MQVFLFRIYRFLVQLNPLQYLKHSSASIFGGRDEFGICLSPYLYIVGFNT
jgi:hypothetical protein